MSAVKDFERSEEKEARCLASGEAGFLVGIADKVTTPLRLSSRFLQQAIPIPVDLLGSWQDVVPVLCYLVCNILQLARTAIAPHQSLSCSLRPMYKTLIVACASPRTRDIW